MTKTSHKKNRPFDFKLIDLVEPHTVLYLRQIPGLSTFEIMKTKNLLWQEIAEQMGFPVQFCLNRWNNLRGQFTKEFRQSNELCPKTGLIKGSTWPYLSRLAFLECTIQANKPKKQRISKRKSKPVEEVETSQNVWVQEEEETRLEEEYPNDFNVEDINDASNTLEETYDDDFSIIEEIAEEIVGTENVVEHQMDEYNNMDHFCRIQSLLSSFEGENLRRIEKRLMAFLCKCQLRALGEQTIDDLSI